MLDPGSAHVYGVDMNSRARRFLPLLLAGVLLVGVACSDGVRDAAKGPSRGASGGSEAWPGPAGCETQTPNLSQYAEHGARGYPYCNVNVDKWCNDAVSFYGLPDIGLCFALTNKTRRFTAPDTLGSKFPLTITNAYCESYRQSGSPNDGYLDDQGLCTSTTDYRGSVRVYTLNSLDAFDDQARLLNPNPFMETAAVQFMPHRQSTGPRIRLFVNSKMAPFSTTQAAASPFAEAPFVGTNGGDCDAQGRFISCRLTSSIPTKAWSPKAYYDLGTYPLRLQIKNSSGRPMTLRSESAGSGFLLDPVARGSVESIPSGGTAYVGGYLEANSSTSEMSWTGSYCIDAPAGCINVDVTFRLKFTSDKDALDSTARNYSNVSTCIVENRTAVATYKCNTPTYNNSVESPLLTANITNF